MSKRIITKFENLSNEILYDIFEYFQYEELSSAFHGLNYRINNILNDKRLLMYITFARIKTIQSLFSVNEIQSLFITLSSKSHPSVAADLQDSPLMPCVHRLSLDGVYIPDLRIGLPYIQDRMPNLVHVAIKTYHSSFPSKTTIACIIESFLELSLIRTFSLDLQADLRDGIAIDLLEGKQLLYLEYVSIIGCPLVLPSVINLINHSPNLYSIQMSIQMSYAQEIFSALQQLTKATLKLCGFDDYHLKKFFSSMTRLVSLRLVDELLIHTARLHIPSTARLSRIRF